jgi:hypothetical protein
VGVGTINLGMSREEVREAAGAAYTPFKRLKSDETPGDAFEGGVLVYYKPPGICEAVEVGEPATPTFLERTVLGRPFGEVRGWLEGLDRDLVLDGDGLVSRKLGVSLYAPDVAGNPDVPVQSVLVFEEGYYERATSSALSPPRCIRGRDPSPLTNVSPEE